MLKVVLMVLFAKTSLYKTWKFQTKSAKILHQMELNELQLAPVSNHFDMQSLKGSEWPGNIGQNICLSFSPMNFLHSIFMRSGISEEKQEIKTNTSVNECLTFQDR